MNILITGAAGMIGRKLTERLASEGGLNGRQIDRLTLLDVVMPTTATRFTGKTDLVAADLSTPGEAARAIAQPAGYNLPSGRCRLRRSRA